MENESMRKPKILCLHGFRTSAHIYKCMCRKFGESILEKLDLDFIDAPFPAQGKSAAQGIYDPPYYEWFQTNQNFTEYYNFDECVAFLEDYMAKHGPYDGLMGFSQGAVLSSGLIGMQKHGDALKNIPKLKFVILISGGRFGGTKFGTPKLASNAFSSPIECPSLHFLSEQDFLKVEGDFLFESFVDPVAIHHSMGHTVPIMEGENTKIMLDFIERIQKLL
ncbi:hypothetical protein LWI29_030523 [Acer saccharum]|uniref:Serine hydrolase domain-containing protein n=3 Tax=Acer TaxID=4022 RepID=A0A5C7HVA6_9ROSI|nr:hypothetical protein LWI29_030523 [Acer saccharum]TXG60122.1 hypothetical protein EZV62_014695 [Acer yangbiense]